MSAVLDWLVIGALYLFALACFRFLGGFSSAGEAFQQWGRARAAAWRRRSSAAS